jgi:hypothetical protein
MPVYDLTKWHASLQRDTPALRSEDTGEVRIPLALLRLDDKAGEVDLVLSRREVERLHLALGLLLNGQPAAVCAIR